MSVFRKGIRKLSQIRHGAFNVPVGNDYVGEKARIYEKARSDSEFWINEEKYVDTVITSLAGKGELAAVLDLPAGSGRFYKIYEKNKVTYIGGDSSEDMLALAGTKITDPKMGENRAMLSTSIPLAERSVDMVICFRFLQWIIAFKDVEKTLDEFYRVSRRYCLLELCVGTHEGVKGLQNKNLTMWNNFNFDEICSLLGAHGFRVDSYQFLSDDVENPNMYGFLCSKLD